ncbi:MAG: hypothetical protein FD153_998 [Rhodospirillaceae bacterium]|nr:MAG: hypothetical protein FD153_998 [Rhodospirillaceae bacterium]
MNLECRICRLVIGLVFGMDRRQLVPFHLLVQRQTDVFQPAFVKIGAFAVGGGYPHQHRHVIGQETKSLSALPQGHQKAAFGIGNLKLKSQILGFARRPPGIASVEGTKPLLQTENMGDQPLG